jgi:putative adenylate-forming enzyme
MATEFRSMAIAAAAFARTRWRAHRLRTRADVDRHQAQQVVRYMHDVLPHFGHFSGGVPAHFEDLPITDKGLLMRDFPAFNRAGLSADQVREALAAGQQRIGNLVIGQSTGTSGNRGYYVISDAERFVWLGTILAKTLPDALWRKHRVALALPGISDLYQSASTGSRITLGAFDLVKGLDSWDDDLIRFAPDTIVAPPKVLRRLAETGKLPARNIFSGAEVLDPIDRAVIEGATGHVVRQIYMATEGLFGVSCPYGTLHLAEDVVKFEWEKPDAASTLVAPIVTDFTRTTQAMLRYRMNDLMLLSDAPCPCGSPYQAVSRIEGRQDDIFQLSAVGGGLRMVTPDVLRNAVVDADPRIRDYRIVQTGAQAIEVTLAADLTVEIEERVRDSLAERLAPFALVWVEISFKRGIEASDNRKLRRVRREWPHQAT